MTYSLHTLEKPTSIFKIASETIAAKKCDTNKAKANPCHEYPKKLIKKIVNPTVGIPISALITKYNFGLDLAIK